jgi:zinc transporter 1/2/3
VGKFFGGGVITATGFIHIFPAAVDTLADPCLPEFFQVYTASAGLFALIAALLTHLIEFLAQEYSPASKSNHSDYDPKEDMFLIKKKNDYKEVHEEDAHHHHFIDPETSSVAVYILEAGIAIHSIIIGVDLGLTVEEFRSLFIALVFHQFFEGIGLGYKLAELMRPKSRIQSIINCLLYSFTTPLGVAIGIVTHVKSDSSDYMTSVALKCIMDAMAAGILIYVDLVTLVAAEFSTQSFRKLTVLHKCINFMAFYFGAALMSIIGVWA